MNRQVLSAVVMLITLAAPSLTRAAELSSQMKVGNAELRLNGSGVREKYFLDLYTAGLYLAEPNKNAKAIINADAPMAIRIVITSRMVSQAKLVDSLQEGFQKSTGGKLRPIQKQIDQFRSCFSGEIVRGDVIDLVYAPGKGVTVYNKGKRKGAIAGIEFKKALFGIWLSRDPADAALKQAMLGTTRRK
ncbi:chalcone isomerase family protein [Pirellulales bacterium]|nr:chalcone isomerase family protein [Pirellulales bacterium]